jgi:Hypoxia induced protein conserved region
MNQTLVTIISLVAVLVVAGILFAGLWNMFKGGAGSGNRSQMLMRARVIAQFVAIVVILGALFFFGRGAPPA